MARQLGNNLDFSGNQALNLLLQIVAGDHGSPQEGGVWWDSQAKAIAYFDGTQVKRVGEAGGGGDAETLDGQDGVYYLSRANHSGTQSAATISDFASAVLGVSGIATDTEVANQIAALVDTAPGTLDTLNELAAALGDDPNFAATLQAQIAARTRKASVDCDAALSTTLTHNFNTRDVVVSVRRNSAPYDEIITDVEMSTLNEVTVRFAVAPAAAAFRIIAVG